MDEEQKVRLNSLKERIYEILKEEPFSPWGAEGSGLGWFPPTCPICHNLIGQKFASDRVVCVVCDKEFELREISI